LQSTEADKPVENATKATEHTPAPPPAAKETPAAAPKANTAHANIPTRQYLDQTVVPILLQALSSLAKERLVGIYHFKQVSKYPSTRWCILSMQMLR
jgi:hypothetical protein